MKTLLARTVSAKKLLSVHQMVAILTNERMNKHPAIYVSYEPDSDNISPPQLWLYLFDFFQNIFLNSLYCQIIFALFTYLVKQCTMLTLYFSDM